MTEMTKIRARRSFLLPILGLGLFLYHLGNFFHPGELGFQFVKTDLSVWWSGRDKVNIPTLINVTESDRTLDFSSSRIVYWASRLNRWETHERVQPDQGDGAAREAYQEWLRQTGQQVRVDSRVLERVQTILQTLNQSGVTALFIPVPPGTEVESPQVRQPAVFGRLASLDSAHVVDLYPSLHAYYLKNRRSELFIRDGHWSGLGVAISAKVILDRLRSPGWSKTKAGGRVVVAGTSFSMKYSAEGLDLGSLVARGLGRDLVRFAEPGIGLFGAIRLMAEKRFLLRPGDLFIWEAPLEVVLDSRQLTKSVPIPAVQ